jgi:hypothetical protein
MPPSPTTGRADWTDGCPHCGSDEVEFRERVGVWRWTAACLMCHRTDSEFCQAVDG